MNVYVIIGSGNYCGGCAVVAANTEDEAIKIANNDSHRGVWKIDYGCKNYRPNVVLPVTYNGDAKILHEYQMGE